MPSRTKPNVTRRSRSSLSSSTTLRTGHQAEWDVESTKTAAAESALKAVELFCGIGGFRIAADRLGIETVWANDFNKLACSVYRRRFDTGTLVEGDINELIHQVPQHDLLTAGFPCQPFSAAGKKLGIKDPRGSLFQSIVDVLEQRQPRFFVLENVKRLLTMEGGVHFATVLAALSQLPYFVEWRVLNAKHFGLAQNRERVVIVGHRVPRGQSVTSNLRLLTEKDASQLPARTMTFLDSVDRWQPVEDHATKFPNWGAAFQGMFFAHEVDEFNAAVTPSTLGDVLMSEVPSEYDFTAATLSRLHMNETVDRFIQGVEIVSNQGGGARMGYTIFGTKGLAPTLTASTSRHYERYQVGSTYRRLTPTEYARLQGFPDNHCDSQKPYDQYGLYGNAVPPVLVEWAMKRLIQGEGFSSISHRSNQPELFDVF